MLMGFVAQRIRTREPGELVKEPQVQTSIYIYWCVFWSTDCECTDALLLDYVFDGTSPPYTSSSTTNPVNLYGQTKRDGELAVLGVSGAQSIVLRVPVL